MDADEVRVRVERALTASTDRAELATILAVEAHRRRLLAEDWVLDMPVLVRTAEDEPADATSMGRPEADGVERVPFGEWAGRSAVMASFGRVLHRLARALGGPVLELGTGAAVSTCYLASGLSPNSDLVSVEAQPQLVDRARTSLSELDLPGTIVLADQASWSRRSPPAPGWCTSTPTTGPPGSETC